MYMPMYVCLCMYVFMHVCTHVCIYVYIHAYIYTHACMHAFIHSFGYIRTWIYTHIHIHARTHIYIDRYTDRYRSIERERGGWPFIFYIVVSLWFMWPNSSLSICAVSGFFSGERGRPVFLVMCVSLVVLPFLHLVLCCWPSFRLARWTSLYYSCAWIFVLPC